jgi:8-oxo-dGTP diphosphatase
MGIHPDFHRRGIGRSLVAAAEEYALELGVEYIQVKTLDTSHPSLEYARTRTFYESLGFRPLEVFPDLWDEENPCLLMVKKNTAIEPRVGVGVIITREDGRVLLVQRKNFHGAGTWSTPGGHMDFGETPQECACRETREETGVEISGVHFRAITNDVFKAPGKHYITIWMEARLLSGEAYIAAEYEATDIGWFAWDALPQPLFLPFENLIKGNCLSPLQGL